MVVRWYSLALLAAASLALAGTSCKVLVDDNCANQAVPGNEFCRELYGNAGPYCSPCRRANNGCVETPPFSCQGYYDEVSDNEPEPTPDEDSSGLPPDDEPMTTSGEVATGSSSDGAATDSGSSGGGTATE